VAGVTAPTSGDEARGPLLLAYQAALTAVDGRRCVQQALRAKAIGHPVYLIALGKAACAMAAGADDALGPYIRDAFVVTKHDYASPLRWPVREAGHPLPDAASLAAGAALGGFIERIPESGHVIVLLSGGASALIDRMPDGMSLAQLRGLNAWLLASGLAIGEMNALRRRVSLIKGGRLAKQLSPRPVLCLAISDVPGDDPRAIASGPLSPDPDAGRSFDAFDAPVDVQPFLRHPPPAPMPDDPCFARVQFDIVACLADAKAAAARAARAMGYATIMHDAFIDGAAAEAGEALARKLLQSAPRTVHVWGGEATMHLPASPGRGGRAQHMALAAATVLAGQPNVTLLVAASDGTDGNTDDAGALIDGGTIARGEAAGDSVVRALAAADSGRFLEAAGDLIQTGPTGTNVMDLMIGIRLG